MQMTESNQNPVYVFDGDYANFPKTLKLLEHHTKQIKNKKMDPDTKVFLRRIYYFMLMSTYPKTNEIDWTMDWHGGNL